MAKTNMTCPCCDRGFTNDEEIVAFQSKMNELGDPEVSELHAMASKKATEIRLALEKYENWRRAISENMGQYLELERVNTELREMEGLINDEEGGGYGSLKELEAELKTEEDNLAEKKNHTSELRGLMNTCNVIQDTAKRVWEKLRTVNEKKDILNHQFFGNDVNDPRDLKTVEKDLTKSSEKKEQSYTNINTLNNEQKK